MSAEMDVWRETGAATGQATHPSGSEAVKRFFDNMWRTRFPTFVSTPLLPAVANGTTLLTFQTVAHIDFCLVAGCQNQNRLAAPLVAI